MLVPLLGLALLLPPQGERVPANDGWVTDLAGVLAPSEERALEALMESYRQGTGHELAVLTVPSLEGRTIEGFALAVARDWGIGRADEHDGALLVLARDDREMRIEVGRGLEDRLTDAISGRILRDVIAPELRQGRFHDGIRAGVEAMHAAIGGDYGPLERSAGARRSSAGLAGCLAVGVNLAFWLLIVRVLRGRRGRGGRGGLGGFLPWMILASMSQGRGHGGGSGGAGFGGGGFGGGGFGGFGGGGGFSGGGASGGW